jgi:putative ABC transport system permease protein
MPPPKGPLISAIASAGRARRRVVRLRFYLQAVFRNLRHKPKAEGELDAEVRGFAEMLADERIAAGMPPGEAQRTALADCGGVEQVKQAVRDSRTGVGFQIFGQDVRYGLRQLHRNRGFATLAILTLAIGIGANTAIFSFVNAILLRPLPYPDADRLTILWSGLGYSNRAPFSTFELDQIRQRAKQFDQVAGIWVTNGPLPGEGDAQQVKLGIVTSNFLTLLCTRPALGRSFGPEDDAPNSATTIVISHGVWVRRFGSDPAIVGKSVRFGKGSAVVVGVLPGNFRLLFPDDASVPSNVEVFNSIPIGPSDPQGPSFLHLIGRLRDGSSTLNAQAEGDSIAKQINSLAGRSAMANFRFYVIPLQADDVREVRSTLLLLFGGVGLVLLIGCANIANLLMARAWERQRETTIRAALGASRGRLVRQLFTESLLLGCFGGVAALGLGWVTIRAILSARPPSFTNFGNVNLDWRVLAFTFAVAICTSLLFGLAPITAVRHLDLNANFKEAGRQGGRRRRHRISVLVSAEVALAFVLLVATGLIVRTFVNILRLDPGFRADNVSSFRISVPGYAPLWQVQQTLKALPGVQSASAISHIPLDDAGNWYDYYWKEGAPTELQNTEMADHRSILPGYFTTIGASLLQGRDFTMSDDAAHQRVAIIDDVLARQLWPNGEAIGRKLNISDSPNGPYQFQRDWVIVVGVVHHVQYHSLTALVRPQIYVPYQLAPRPSMSIVVRTAGFIPDLADSVRKQVALVNRDMPTSQVEPLSAVVDRAHAESRFASLLATLLSVIALLLACIGIYGVLSYSVAQRTVEIGIRMAIGAHRTHVMKMVLADGIAWVLPGLAAGFVLSLAVGPLLARLLYGVKPGNAENYLLILALVVFLSAIAAFLPARRAMKIEPLTALRYE